MSAIEFIYLINNAINKRSYTIYQSQLCSLFKIALFVFLLRKSNQSSLLLDFFQLIVKSCQLFIVFNIPFL